MGQKTRQEQIASFFHDHEEEVQQVARQEAWWPRPAGDSRGLEAFLLPQGFQRPEVETCWSGSSTTGSERGKRSGRSKPSRRSGLAPNR